MPKKIEQENFIKAKGRKCPNCQSKNIMQISFQTDEAWGQTECHDCGALWEVIYKLDGFASLRLD